MDNKIDDITGEVFKQLEGYKGEYDISNYGRIRSYYKRSKGKDLYGQKSQTFLSDKPQMFIKVNICKKGTNQEYARVNLGRRPNQKHFIFSRLVYSLFGVKDISGKYVIHKDGDTSNNNINNLEVVDIVSFWKQRSVGEANYNSKLTHNQIIIIKDKYKNSCKEILKSLSSEYGISERMLVDILSNKNWKTECYNQTIISEDPISG